MPHEDPRPEAATRSEVITAAPPQGGAGPSLRYQQTVYQSLTELGATNPDALLNASGDYWRNCMKLGIAPQVAAACIYGSERHRHEVTRTTIQEPTLGLTEATAEGDPSAMSEEAPKTAYRYADVSFDRLDDAQKFAKAIEKTSRSGVFVAGTQHGATVTTNAAPDVISKTLRRHRWKGGWKMTEAAKMAAEEAGRGSGGVQSQIAAKTTDKSDCQTCIPWQKLSRDPKQHEEFAALAKKYGSIKTPKDVYAVVGHDLNRESAEVFLVLPLNIHGELMAPPYEVARGQRDRVAVGIDNVVDAASDAQCAGYIVCHNHPGGSPEPSPADMKLTRDIRAATPPGRSFIDHVVIGVRTAYSCVEKKLYKIK